MLKTSLDTATLSRNNGRLNVTITSQIVVYSPARRAEKPLLFLLYPSLLCGWGSIEDGCRESRARVYKRLRSPGINFQPSIPPAYVSRRAGTPNKCYRADPKAIHRLAESISWNRFPGFVNIYKFGLWISSLWRFWRRETWNIGSWRGYLDIYDKQGNGHKKLKDVINTVGGALQAREQYNWNNCVCYYLVRGNLPVP